MSGKRKQRGEDFKQEDILQAVVIADSFNVRFAPVTREKPRALLPLANIPLLEYTLEFLCSAGIQEVIVFCCVHSNHIKNYLANSKWSGESCPMDVLTVVSEDCLSVGDALRDIDAKSLVSSDFVLVNGDIISNIKLKPIIAEHKARRLREKTPIMTMLFKKAPPGHMTRCPEDEVIVVTNTENKQVLKYQKIGNEKKFELPLEIVENRQNVQLHYDLLDTHISVCSPNVTPLFTDNFDYLTREDFVKGILVNEEILGNTIHVHVVEDEYAARVSNLHMYDAVSQDIMNRWSYPMVPDACISNDSDDRYSYGRHNVYVHKDVTLARDCRLLENVVIGPGSSVGNKTRIRHSVIGKNCTIGDGVQLERAYVWDGARIDDQCQVTMAVVDQNVHLKKNVYVTAGCVIARDVVIGPNVTLNQCTSLMSTPPDDDDDDDDFGDEPTKPEVAVDHELVGSEGRGFQYIPPTEDEDDDEELVQSMWGLSLAEFEDEEEDNDDEEEYSEGEEERGDEEDEGGLAEEAQMFYEEVISTLERAQAENIGTDNMILEVNSVKHAYGIQIQEVNVLVTKAILEYPLVSSPDLEPTQYLSQLRQNWKMFLPLLKNYIKSSESQKDFLNSMEETSLSKPVIQTTLVRVLQFLYEAELLSEEEILGWNNKVVEDNKAERKQIRAKVAPFINWLQEAEEESDSDESEDD